MTTPRRVEVWEPITDIEPDLRGYRDAELAGLAPAWAQRRHELENGKALRDFNDRLARSWAIETGILERLYTLDRGVTRLLLERGFDIALLAHNDTDVAPQDLIATLEAHREALEGLFAFVRGGRSLGTSYIKELHAALTRAQEWVEAIDSLGRSGRTTLLRGEWKRQDNNPTRSDGTVFVYCPSQQVPGQMEELIRLHQGQQALAPEVRAAWLHHRFTQIHPFQDGNGRVARALASLEFIRAGLFPLLIDRDDRAEYIGCLETADAGNLRPLVDLMAKAERRSLLAALGLVVEALDAASTVAASTRGIVERLRRSQEKLNAGAEQSARVAGELATVAFRRLANVKQALEHEVAAAGLVVRVNLSRSTDGTAHYFQAQIAEVARRLNYVPSTGGPRRWVRLQLLHQEAIDLVLSFHFVGPVAGFAMACTAFVNVRQRSGDERVPSSWRITPAGDVYAFSGALPVEETLTAFEPWVDGAIREGLDLMQEQL